MIALRVSIGVLLVVGGWWLLRRAVGAGRAGGDGQRLAVLGIDACPAVMAWLGLVAVSARPLLAAIVLVAVGFGLLRGNAAKQRSSDEPLVFSDWALAGIFRHPSLYAEFTSPEGIALQGGASLLVVAGLGALEPPLWGGAVAVVPILLLAGVVVGFRGVWVRRLREMAQGRVSVDPVRNLQELGPFAGTVVHAVVARRDRGGLQAAAVPGRSVALPQIDRAEGPVVLLQMESFFDARRLGLAPADLLPEYDRSVAGSVLHGRLATPAFGANTVRTEFAVLTGLAETALGVDRFNPYLGFARVPIDSLAWRLRALGYQTVCLHPFAGRFYGRDKVMPQLGFDRFIDIAGFERPAGGGYVADGVLVRKVAALLEELGPRTFVFGISMGNHSPWQRPAGLAAGATAEEAALAGVLQGLRRTDAALGFMVQTMREHWPTGVLGSFGDHQPCLPGLDRQGERRDRSTDYVVWRANHALGQRRDIPAHALPWVLLEEASRPARGRMGWPKQAGHSHPGLG